MILFYYYMMTNIDLSSKLFAICDMMVFMKMYYLYGEAKLGFKICLRILFVYGVAQIPKNVYVGRSK